MSLIVQLICAFFLLDSSSSTSSQSSDNSNHLLHERFTVSNNDLVNSMQIILTQLSYNYVDELEKRFRSRMANRFQKGFSSDSSEDLDDYLTFTKARGEFLMEVGKLNQSLPIIMEEILPLKIFATRADAINADVDLHYQFGLFELVIPIITALFAYDVIKWVYNRFSSTSEGYKIARESFHIERAKLFSPSSEYVKAFHFRFLASN